jgi:hypothetical protein
VGFYAFAANGTDRYPPFTLGEAEYPATLEIAYPERLSRGLVLVKWWLLAIPHYVVVALFVGGGTWAAWQAGDRAVVYGGGLVGVLVCFAVVVLLFTGRYPRGIFDLVLGMDRWALRVAAYAGLMTDHYPPFRLDLGGSDQGALALEPPEAPRPGAPTSAGWSGGRIAGVVVGSFVALLAAAAMIAGITGVVVDQTQRDDEGFVMSATETYSTSTYALVSDVITVDVNGVDWVLDDLVGDVKVRSVSDEPVFVGIGPTDEVSAYLRGVRYEQVGDLAEPSGTVIPGRDRPADPAAQRFWVASSTGAGEQALRWNVQDGDWRAVVMADDGSRPVEAELAIGAEVPDLLSISLGLLAGGAVLLALGGVALVAAVRGSGR